MILATKSMDFAISLLIALLAFAAGGAGIWHAAIVRASQMFPASASGSMTSQPDNTIWGKWSN